MVASNLREITDEVLATLTPREEKVIKMRFGLGTTGSEHTLEEVGQHFARHARTHPADRGESVAQTASPITFSQAQGLSRKYSTIDFIQAIVRAQSKISLRPCFSVGSLDCLLDSQKGCTFGGVVKLVVINKTWELKR